MYKPMPLKMPKPPESNEKRLNQLDGGLNVRYVESLINDIQSPYMLNLNANDRGALTKRDGQVEFHTFSGGPIYAAEYYKNKFIAAHGDKISAWDGETETQLLSGLAKEKGEFFIFNDILLYLNGKSFSYYNGTAAGNVEGYIPTITISRPPEGGGEVYEEWNLISSGFTDSFSGTVGATAYTLSFGDLDKTEVTAKVFSGTKWVDKVEGTDFSVDRSTGIVTFNDPTGEGTNNVLITAYKTFKGMRERITGCRKTAMYGGGSNDSRIFATYHKDYPNVYRWTGLTGNTANDYRYWPENSFNRIGSDAKYITGFAKFYAMLILFKEDSVFSIKYDYQGASQFPVSLLNSQVGCDMPDTIQIIQNAPVWCHTQYGVYTIIQTLIESEKNIASLSGNVNGVGELRPGLLDEDKTDLLKATSVDYDGKYWLCVKDKVWVWDYEQSPFPQQDESMYKWFFYDNINANCFLIHERELYHGDRATGRLTKFHKPWNDYGEAINGVWRSKLFDFDYPDWQKTVSEVWIKTRSGNNTNIYIVFYDDNNVIQDKQEIRSKSFSLDSFSLAEFTLAIYRFPIEFKKKPKQKKIKHWQIEMSNNEVDKNLSIMGLVVRYTLDAKVK